MKTKTAIASLFLVIFVLLSFSIAADVYADAQQSGTSSGDSSGSTTTTLSGTITNPLTGREYGADNAEKATTMIIGEVIKIIFGLVGALALLVFVIGGVYWVTSLGNQERIKRGRNAMTWATIGLLLIFSSYAVINFVFNTLINIS